MTDANMQMIRDPKHLKSRIFVGNLPTCTREELESICHPYGKVLGSMVYKHFGFVQFETAEIANEVASSLTKSRFKGNVLTVRNAVAKPPVSDRTAIETPAEGTLVASNVADANPGYNDCEIIVFDRRNRKYAEYVKDKLKLIAAMNKPPGNNRASHPAAIQVLLKLFDDNMPLTVSQYVNVIKYLKEQREIQLKIELGETSESEERDPEIELQKKILEILKKPSVAETHHQLLYPTTQSLKEDSHVMELLKDERVHTEGS